MEYKSKGKNQMFNINNYKISELSEVLGITKASVSEKLKTNHDSVEK